MFSDHGVTEHALAFCLVAFSNRQTGSTLTENALVTVLVVLERTSLWHADIVGLLLAQLAEFGAHMAKVEGCHFLIEVLGQDIDVVLVLPVFVVRPQLNLREGLVREAG